MAFYPRDVSFIQRNDDNNLYTQVNISSSNAIFYTDENGHLTSSKIEEKFPYTWPSSSYAITSSYSFNSISSSFASRSISASWAAVSYFNDSHLLSTSSFRSWVSSSVSRFYGTSSFSLLSSYALASTSASYAKSSSYALSSSISEYSLTSNSSSYSDYSFYSLSASRSDSSSYSTTSSYTFTSSYTLSSSFSQDAISSSYTETASYALNAGSGGGAEQLNTGSLYPITSSWAEDSISSSVSLNAETADFAVHSHASLVSDTADYAIITDHALSTETSDYAVDTAYAVSSSHALWADTASHVIGITTFSGSINNYVPIWLNNTLTPTSSLYNNQSKIGINNTSPLTTLHVGDGNDNNSVDSVILISRMADNTIAGNGHAFSDSTRFGRSGTVAYNSFDARNIMTGSYNYDHYAGFQYATTYDFDGTLTNAYGYASIPYIKNGNITNLYGSFIFNPSKTGGNVTNNYGLYVQELTIGTNRWGVYVAGSTPSYFGGGMTGSMFGTYVRCTYIGTSTNFDTNYSITIGNQAITTGSNSAYVMGDRSLVPEGESSTWSIYNNNRILRFYHSGSDKMTLDKTGSLTTTNFIGQTANINDITCNKITSSFNGPNYLGITGIRSSPVVGYNLTVQDRVFVTGSNAGVTISDRSMGESNNWTLFNQNGSFNLYRGNPIDATRLWIDSSGNMTGSQGRTWWLPTGSIIASSFTGSLLGTASWARNAVSSSFSITSSYSEFIYYNVTQSALYSTMSLSSSFASSSISSSWSLNSLTSSYVSGARSIVSSFTASSAITSARADIGGINCNNITASDMGSFGRLLVNTGVLSTPTTRATINGTLSVTGSDSSVSFYDRNNQSNNGWSIRADDDLIFREMTVGDKIIFSRLGGVEATQLTASSANITSITGSISGAKADFGDINCNKITSSFNGPNYLGTLGVSQTPFPGITLTVRNRTMVTGSDSGFTMMDRNLDNTNWTIFAQNGLLNFYKGSPDLATRLWIDSSGNITGSNGRTWWLPTGSVIASSFVGNLNGTASWAENSLSSTSLTSSYVTGARSIVASFTASSAITSARADIGSINCNNITTSFNGPNYFGTSVVRRSEPLSGIAFTINGNLGITGSSGNSDILIYGIDSSIPWILRSSSNSFVLRRDSVDRFTLSPDGDVTGSSGRTWSLPNGRIQATSFTGSLHGTASWALNAITGQATLPTGSNYNITSSWSINSLTSSYTISSSYAITSSRAISSISSSYSLTSSYAITSSRSISSISSSYALTSSRAISASWAPSSDPIEPSKTSYFYQTSTTMYLGDGSERQLLNGNRSQTAAGYGDVNREWHITAGGVINDDNTSRDWVWGFGLGAVSMSSIPLPWSGGNDSPWQFDGHLRFTATGAGGKIQGSGWVIMTSHIGATRTYPMAFASETSVNLSTVQDLKLLVRTPTDHEITCSHAIIQERGV